MVCVCVCTGFSSVCSCATVFILPTIMDNLLILFFAEFLKLVHFDWVKKYGPIYRAWGGFRPVAILSSPELMEVRTNDLKLTWIEWHHFISFKLLILADISQSETHHQSDRVQLLESLAGQLHVPDDRCPLEESPSFTHSRFPFSNPQQFRRRFQREKCQLRSRIGTIHWNSRRRRIWRLSHHDAMRIGYHLRWVKLIYWPFDNQNDNLSFWKKIHQKLLWVVRREAKRKKRFTFKICTGTYGSSLVTSNENLLCK